LNSPETVMALARPWVCPPLRNVPILGDQYTSREFFDREWSSMWTKVWLLMGRSSELGEAGSYQMEEVGPESFIMIRQNDGSVKAFYNVCQHRGSRLLFNNEGISNQIVCPYHGWEWDKDGSLSQVQDPEDFIDGNPCDDMTLVEVNCELFAGFIWINMDPECIGLKEYLGPVWEEFEAYESHDWIRGSSSTVDVNCNWKVPQDNSCESYHLPSVHPQGLKWIEHSYKYCHFDWCEEGHNRMSIPMVTPSHSLTGEELEVDDQLREMLEPWGLKAEDFKGREFETRQKVQSAKRETGSERGYQFDQLFDDQLTDAYHYNIFPNVTISFAGSEYIGLQRMRPHRRDPERHYYDNFMYLSQGAAARLDVTEPEERRFFRYGTELMNRQIADQDLAISTGQQLGLASRGYRGVRLAGQEGRVQRFHDVLDEYLDGSRP
tara:strand:+ start:1005 stop:2309 length:1305 start_codon:yes stop_codon:yes gene_type:complete